MKDNFRQVIFIVIGALVLMTDAFYNGFPIVYSDTSTYIASGFELETPFDRPITYGLFLRFSSLNGLSLWFVIFFQSFILSYLVFLFIRLMTGEKKFLRNGLLTILLISLLTSVSWTVSQLMPDIFTSTGLICMAILLFGKYSRRTSILLYILFFISVAMHMSHILLFSIILITLFIFRNFIFPRQAYPGRAKQIGGMLLLTMASIITMGSAISKSRHVFFMGSMVEKGILKNYLDENCESNKYKLCAYKDSLPSTFNDFVWKESSPFYKVGGWKGTKVEFNEIAHETLTQSKYVELHIREAFKATFRQLMHYDIGDGNGSFLESTLLYDRISKYVSHEQKKYSTSKQSESQLDFVHILNVVFSLAIVLSLIVLTLFLFFFNNNFRGHIKSITILFLCAILVNAWTCGTFSMVADRFGSKLIWLIPLAAIASCIKIWRDRRGMMEKVIHEPNA